LILKLFRKRDFITIGFILLFAAFAIGLFYYILKPLETLPIYQPAEVNEKLVDSSIIHVSKYHKIADFKLTNQNGEKITQEYYNDKIYVADFFFTTCQDICPVMTKNMYQLQQELKNDKNILFLSHTVIPEIDTVEQLKKYAIENKIDESRWNLVTGDKKQIYDLARKSYLAVEDVEFGEFDMIHTENFMLIDKQKQIRGFYDGTNTEEIQRLLKDIGILKQSYNN
jgi:protein SCO1/2